MSEEKWMTDLLHVQSTTIIGEINDYYLCRRFVDSDQELEQADKVIGQLSDYEKAMYAVLTRLEEQTTRDDVTADALSDLIGKLQVVHMMFWGSVHMRTGNRIGLFARLAVRRNFTIVLAEGLQRDVMFMIADGDDQSVQTVGLLTADQADDGEGTSSEVH